MIINKMKFFSNKCENIPTKRLWLLFLILPIISYSIYLYTDVCDTTMHGLSVWYTIFEGYSICDFYSMPYPLMENPPYPYYDFFIYIIFAIWDFPLFIFEKITLISFMDLYITRLYAKSIILVFLILAIGQIKRLAYKVSSDKMKVGWTLFTFVFSTMLIQTVFIIGGYDIISLFFTLAGVNAYLEDKDRKFIFWFACAIACKLFALWIFIPLVLLREKRIRYIVLYGISGMSLIMIPRILFKLHEMMYGKITILSDYGPGDASNFSLINTFLWSGEAPLTLHSIPLVFFLYFILWVWCWFNTRKLSEVEIIYICLIGISIFFLSAETYPYWIVLVSPYVAILTCYHSNILKMNLFLEACCGLGYVCVKAITSPQCYNYNLVVEMLRNEPFNKDFYFMGLTNFISKFSDIMGISIDNFRTFSRGIFGAAFVMMLYYMRPNKVEKEHPIRMGDIKYFYWKAIFCVLITGIPLLGVVVRVFVY